MRLDLEQISAVSGGVDGFPEGVRQELDRMLRKQKIEKLKKIIKENLQELLKRELGDFSEEQVAQIITWVNAAIREE